MPRSFTTTLLLLISFFSVSTSSNASLRLVCEETSLGKVHPGILPETIEISPDKKRIAYSAFKLNGKIVVVLDDKESKEYDDVDNFIFSHDSQKFAYAAMSWGKWRAVIDGVEQSLASNGSVKLVLREGISPQDVLYRLAEKDVELEKFEVAVPSLDEIFIHVVEEGEK